MPKDISELSDFHFPQAHSFRVYRCSCPNAHIVLFDEDDIPIAQFVISKLNLQRIIVDANQIFDQGPRPGGDNVTPIRRR